MRRQLMVIISCSLGVFQLCFSQGTVNLPSGLNLVAENESVKVVKTGLKFCEGPVTDDKGNVYFSEMDGENRIWKVTPEGDASVLVEGFSGSSCIDMDPEGYLIAVGEGKVQRICPDKGTGKTLVEQQSFGKLDDITVSSGNRVYFTNNQDEVLYLPPGGRVIAITGKVNQPNGVYLVEERAVMMVTDCGDSALLQFDVQDDGRLKNRRKLANVPEPGGLCMDVNSNIYAASLSQGKLYVFNSTGKQLGTIALTGDSDPKGNVSNCTFGGKDNKTLYITGDGGLYSLRMNIPGRRKWPQQHKYINKLSPEEKADGYVLLFNGKNLEDDWRSYRRDTIARESWQVVTEGLHGTHIQTIVDGSGKRVSLMSRKRFKNFDLKLEWTCALEGNSGIFYRYLDKNPNEWREVGRTGPEAAIVGPEYRIPKNSQWDVGRRGFPGSCYQIKGPVAGRRYWHNAWDQYNEFRVVCYEKRVAHYGNGLKLLEYEIDSPEWTKMYEISVYKDAPLYGRVHAGSIRLEHKNKKVRYRNIRIKELEENPWEGKELGALPDRLSLSDNFPLGRTE